LYPNPSSGLINLSVNDAENLKITSLLGGVVFEKDKLEKETMDIRHLPAGIYNCSYYSENTYRSEKLLITK
jgi:formylmethanofuran dehydrogenase subunit D